MRHVVPSLAVLALLGSLAACNPSTPPTPPTPPDPPSPPVHEPVVARELMITDLSVVNDARATGADGVWSFGGLIKAMAGSTAPGVFARDWLVLWDANQ